MAKIKKPSKPRAAQYEDKLKFDGTFEQMIDISLTGAGAKKKQPVKAASKK